MELKSLLAVYLPLCAAPLAAARPASNAVFIVGGSPAEAGEFPFIVSTLRNGRHWCGGVLLNANTVLTAAHCVESQPAISQVRAGSLAHASGGVVANISSITPHPKYEGLGYDMAIVKLSTPIEANGTIGYATLPEAGSDPVSGADATVAGWGDLEYAGQAPEELQKVTVPVVDRATCSAAYQAIPNMPNITDAMFCAGLKEGGQDACNGDSGGPIIDTETRVLIGVVSWGYKCAAPNAYGVYTRLGADIEFIKSHL
ncbi:Trypsin [Metarhizium brunneum]|uniref:Trypsin n=1 Tax=Metarhizium brunneum TaxID=500148 RepID=A0A7D5Z281_9HYPO